MKILENIFCFLNLCSSNGKTGPIATLKTSMNTCPDSCSWKENGCYAKYGPITIHWRNLHKIGVQFLTVLKEIRRIPRGEYFRLFEAGDAPGNGKYRLYKDACLKLAEACKHLIAFGYTHYRPNKHNLPILKAMNEKCTLNLSADSLEEADELFKTGLPVVSIIPKDSPSTFFTENGIRVIKCPYEQFTNSGQRKVKNCMTCAKGSGKGPLCYWQDRDFIVGFPPHGSGAKYLNTEMEGYDFEEVENKEELASFVAGNAASNVSFVGVMS